MKRVLVLHFSQTGQLRRLMESVTAPLKHDPNIDLTHQQLLTKKGFPFPWPFLTFFSIFPETVAMIAPAMKPLDIDCEENFDLVILAYQVWFLSPSLPTTGFLKSEAAEKLLLDKPVVTLIGCRNMWLMAQEKMKSELQRLGARLVDNVVLIDNCNSAASFLATPLWMFTGRKQPLKWIPKAGIDEDEITKASRFGDAIRERLQNDEPIRQPMLAGLGAVKINEKLIASEKVGQRSFRIWGRFLRFLGPQTSIRRRIGLVFYVVFLLCIILTVVPVTALLKWLLTPLTRKHIAAQKAYYAAPSGE